MTGNERGDVRGEDKRKAGMGEILNQPLTNRTLLTIIEQCICKNVDEDSKVYPNAIESRGRWKPDASKLYLNITSELRLSKGAKRPSRFRRYSPVTGKAYDSMFRWFINETLAFVLFRTGAFLI